MLCVYCIAVCYGMVCMKNSSQYSQIENCRWGWRARRAGHSVWNWNDLCVKAKLTQKAPHTGHGPVEYLCYVVVPRPKIAHSGPTRNIFCLSSKNNKFIFGCVPNLTIGSTAFSYSRASFFFPFFLEAKGVDGTIDDKFRVFFVALLLLFVACESDAEWLY